jgi:hypothetical protein
VNGPKKYDTMGSANVVQTILMIFSILVLPISTNNEQKESLALKLRRQQQQDLSQQQQQQQRQHGGLEPHQGPML